MLPLFENLDIWLFVALLSVVSYFFIRKSIQKQLATAPAASLRNTNQRKLHWLSILMIVMPLAYVFLIDSKPFWSVLSVLWIQAGAMGLLRVFKIGWVYRSWLLLPVTVFAFLGGAFVFKVQIESTSLVTTPWLSIALSALAFAASNLLSVFSFPLGYGERAR